MVHERPDGDRGNSVIRRDEHGDMSGAVKRSYGPPPGDGPRIVPLGG